MAGAHHRTPQYVRDSKLVRTAATNNTMAVCWRDGLTLDQHPGTGHTWHAGHTQDGTPGPPWLDVTHTPPPGPWLAPETAYCNTKASAHRTNSLQASTFNW